MLPRFCFVLALAIGCGGSTAGTTETTPEPRTPYSVASGDVAAAMAGEHRTEDERARDRYRLPAETLEHFGLRPDMTVVEIWPGGGWYTKILAPVLREDGKLIAAHFDTEDTTFRGTFARRYAAMLAEAPEIYDRVEPAVLDPDDLMSSVPDASVDLVISPRNTHNWIRWEGHDAAAYFGAVLRVLKPGGVFGIVQHRAPEGTEHGEDGTIGYLTESVVRGLAEAAGLEFVSRSDMHANERDTHDHPEGVWSLPPVLRGGETDRERYVAIGESDRMTLMFRRPEDAGPAPASPPAASARGGATESTPVRTRAVADSEGEEELAR